MSNRRRLIEQIQFVMYHGYERLSKGIQSTIFWRSAVMKGRIRVTVYIKPAPMAGPLGRTLLFSIYLGDGNPLVVAALTLLAIDDRLDHTIGHAQSDDVQGIPQSPVKNEVSGIPNPFKTKW
jgi:hypothetical protein